MTARSRHRSTDRGAGVFSTAFAVTAFLLFLLFAAQLLFGMYARTTVAAIGADVARLAATGPALDDARQLALADEGRRRLGAYGDDADFSFAVIDTDTDGAPDVVAVTVAADLPQLLPLHWSPTGPTRFTQVHRSRLELVRGTTP